MRFYNLSFSLPPPPAFSAHLPLSRVLTPLFLPLLSLPLCHLFLPHLPFFLPLLHLSPVLPHLGFLPLSHLFSLPHLLPPLTPPPSLSFQSLPFPPHSSLTLPSPDPCPLDSLFLSVPFIMPNVLL